MTLRRPSSLRKVQTKPTFRRNKMNIRCSFFQTPFTLSRVAILDALQEMDSKNLTHYDAHCPKCRRANPIQRQRMEMFMPNWKDELKEFEKEMKENPQQEAPLPAAE